MKPTGCGSLSLGLEKINALKRRFSGSPPVAEPLKNTTMKKLAFFFAPVVLIAMAFFALRTRPHENPRRESSREEDPRKQIARQILSENADWETGPRHREVPGEKNW